MSKRKKTLLTINGRMMPKESVEIIVKIDNDMPRTVFHDMLKSFRAAMWDYIATRAQKDEEWKEITPFD